MSVNVNEYFRDAPLRLDEVYHGNSKHSPAAISLATPIQAGQRNRRIHATQRAARGRYRSYARLRRFELPREPLPLRMSLGMAISRRRSQRVFGEEPISTSELATLLSGSYGTGAGGASESGRPTPSGGGLYPLDLYVLQVPGRTACAGVYHYHPGEHVLQCVRATCASTELGAASMYPEIVLGASAILVIVADMQRSRFKYGERSYRLVLLEAGHVSQTVYLIAAALQLGVVALDGFYDDRLHALLDIDGVSEIAVASLAIGRLP